MARNSSFFAEIWEYLRIRKKWWLLPIIVMLIIIGAAVIVTQSTTLSPFIYALI